MALIEPSMKLSMIAALLGLFSDALFGQSLNSVTTPLPRGSTAASYLCITKPDDLTMMVNIWGNVRSPGRYEVSSSTNLVQLLSCAGGPEADGSISDIVIARNAGSGAKEVWTRIEVNLEKPEERGMQDLSLHPGDTIYLQRTGWAVFKDVLDVVATISYMTLAVATIIIATND